MTIGLRGGNPLGRILVVSWEDQANVLNSGRGHDGESIDASRVCSDHWDKRVSQIYDFRLPHTIPWLPQLQMSLILSVHPSGQPQ